MTQKYLLTFSTSNLKLKFLGVIAICLFTLFAITSCGGAKDRKKGLRCGSPWIAHQTC